MSSIYENDLIFRMIAVAGFACLFPIGMHYRLNSDNAKERLDRRQEGLIRTRKEEENLIARFGDGYREMIRTRGKIFPRFVKHP